MLTAQRLKSLRDQKQLSQEDCAKALGLDRTTYVKYENGGSIKRNVEKLATFFGVSVDYLLGRTNDPAPPATAYTTTFSKDLSPAPGTDLWKAMQVLEESEETISLVHSTKGLSEADIKLLKEVAKSMQEKHNIT